MSRPLRLVDLRADWLSQYAPEITLFDPTLYPGVSGRLGQLDGYLQATRLAVFVTSRLAEDWGRQADRWGALGEMLARYEAEFPGRFLLDRADLERFEDDPEGLCWGVLGVSGLDALCRTVEDIGHLPLLFERGVRVFAPAGGGAGGLGFVEGVGLTELGRAFLEGLASIGAGKGGPRPILDLAGSGPRGLGATLDWFEADPARRSRVVPLWSHGALDRPGSVRPGGMTLEALARLRALGGVVGLSVGPPHVTNAAELKTSLEAAACSLPGRRRFEGLAIGTGFPGLDATLPGLGQAGEVAEWLVREFEPESAAALIEGNARRFLCEAVGFAGVDEGG